MLVIDLSYWPGGDFRRVAHQGWIVVVRSPAPPSVDPEAQWLAILVHHGRRKVSRAEGPDALSVVATVLLHHADIPSRPVNMARGDWQLALDITDRVTQARASAVRHDQIVRSADSLRPGPPLSQTPPPAVATGPYSRRGVRQQVLALPCLTDEEVQALFQRSRDLPAVVRGFRKAGVIAAARHNGRRLYPAFQFQGARPHPVVAAVNLLLGADIDPWAALTWWVQHNNDLGARPLDLLPHRLEIDRLLTAAGMDPGPQMSRSQ